MALHRTSRSALLITSMVLMASSINVFGPPYASQDIKDLPTATAPLPDPQSCQDRYPCCVAGPPGTAGPPGLNGMHGLPGAYGPAGPKGDDGIESNIPGPKGDQGPSGQTGDEGAPGFDGLDGSTGPTGPAGPKGDDGIESNIPGPKGDQGPSGQTGDEGAPGFDGLDGSTGPTGAQGEKGSPGNQGSKGDPGTPYTPPLSVFVAHRTSHFQLTTGDRIIDFEVTKINIGSDFTPSVGLFTCRIPGLYFFAYTLYPLSDGDSIQVRMQINGSSRGNVLVTGGSSAHSARTIGSFSTILALDKDDQVVLRAYAITMILGSTHGLSSFTGCLLYETTSEFIANVNETIWSV